MKHPFSVLQPEYEALIARARILPTKEGVIKRTAIRLLKDVEVYKELSNRTPNKIPAAWLMAISEREMSGNLHCYLGNGQPLNRRTTIVPIGRGPFTQAWPENFYTGALDAFKIDGLTLVTGWSMAMACYQSEVWNGWGYRSHGIPSPYIFGATTVQKLGKYVADHDYSSTTMDPQLGTLPIMEMIIKIRPELAFDDPIKKLKLATTVDIQPAPIGVGGEVDLKAVQKRLNELEAQPPLIVDGVYGKKTRLAIREFQASHGLEVDGLVGPKTLAALKLGE